MIGSFVKKLWKNWPVEETEIMAEDLNKYEESLEEHDQALVELSADLENHAEEIAGLQNTYNRLLSSIETNSNNIRSLGESIENLNHAGNMADNSVLLTDEEKVVGSIGGHNIYQRGYVRYIPAGSSGGVEYFDPLGSSQNINGIILDVKVAVSENGQNLFVNDSISSINNGSVSVSYSSVYKLVASYSGFDENLAKVMFVTVRYVKLNNVQFTYQGRCRVESGALIAEITGQSIYANVGDIYKLTAVQNMSTQNIRSTGRFDVVTSEVTTLGSGIRWNDDSPVNIDDVLYVRIESESGVPVPKVYRTMESLYR